MTTPQETTKMSSGEIAMAVTDVAIVGLGYVGLPLAVTFAEAGLKVIGVDVDAEKVSSVNSGVSYIEDIDSRDLQKCIEHDLLAASTDFSVIRDCDAVIVAVPTPLNRNREPDLSLVEKACASIAPHLRSGHLVVLESTTWPGTTREIVQPILEKSGLVAGTDFFLAYSPERVDPGNTTWTTKNTPKVLGGITHECAERGSALYSRAIENVHLVSTTDVAELTKLFENIFRSVNIALVNELAMLCDRMGIDIWEVIDAAATKPFGFMRFTPGPGLGGHCIPIDPFYLTWKAREFDFATEFIELAGKINSNMPYHCLRRIEKALHSQKKSINGAKLLLLGMSYKRDVGDYRESPAIKVLALLERAGADARYHDIHVPSIGEDAGHPMPSREARDSVELTPERVASADAVVVLTDHSHIDYDDVLSKAKLVVDFRNVLPDLKPNERLWKL